MIEEWCQITKVNVNVKKCNVCSYSRNTNKIEFNYSLGGEILLDEHSIKDLVVLFDSKLSHINNVAASTRKAHTLLYSSLVSSKLE